MSLESQINLVIEYLTAQSILITHVQWGKLGNGTAELTFNFSKTKHSQDQVQETLSQFGKKSLKITKCTFSDSPNNKNLGIATVQCNYDFTQELHQEEVEKIAAAKGIANTKLYKESKLSDLGTSSNWVREVRVDDQGNYYGTPYWKSDSATAKSRAEGKAVKITKAQADSTDGRNFDGIKKSDGFISC